MSDLVITISVIFTIAMAVGVVFSRSAINSSFCLVLCFLGLSSCYIEWESPFLGLVQVLIYTGAIVVLFVFVVMLLNLQKTARENLSFFSVGFASAAIWVFSVILLKALSHTPKGSGVMLEEAMNIQSFRAISLLLFTRFLWPFEVLSFFMLALVVAIYVLARPEGEI